MVIELSLRMMYYRRKIILSIIHLFGNKIAKIQLMKLLLIIRQRQIDENIKYYFDFIPYKYGCYSFEASYDLQALTTIGKLESDDNNYYLNLKDFVYINELFPHDHKIITDVVAEFKNYSNHDLMKYTYEKYPYYEDERPFNDIKALYTIGYEGISIDTFINKLIRYNIKVLVDVRRNAFSMKKGFNKNQLNSTLKKFDIQYVHFPELGIESESRKKLSTDVDYRQLFNKYEADIISGNPPQIDLLLDILFDKHQVAIMCFEAEVCNCHRGTLATLLKKNKKWKSEYGIRNI